METLAKRANEEGLVIFVGAGISMLPPTSLPSWYDLNRMTLSALAARVGEYVESPTLARSLLGDLIVRGGTDRFAPDYQAQLMVEECGSDYFRVLQALDTDVRNPCHDAVALLAKNGKLKAILTTNFDRLCESALQESGVPYRAYADLNDFEELKRAVEADSVFEEIPVVKIHGTVDKVGSMVDTLQQRIRGRGADLPFVLERLQKSHHWLFIGFSGADFDYNPNYLAIRSGLDGGKGFTFLVRSGQQARRSVQELIADYGGRARTVEGELPTWLFGLLETLNLPSTGSPVDERVDETRAAVKARIDDWARSMDIMQVIAIFSALLTGADANIKSYSLLRSVWRHYRKSEDSEGRSYGRFCYRFGSRLLEHGVTPSENWEDANRVTTTISTGENLPVVDDAFQFLARAKAQFGIQEATPNLALALAHEGDLPRAEAALSESLKYAADTGSNTVWSDGVHAAALIRYLQRDWSGGLELLAQSHDLVRWDGDEPRRARYNAWLGAHLAWNHRFDMAQQFIQEGLEISDSLGLTAIRGDNLWAREFLRRRRGMALTPSRCSMRRGASSRTTSSGRDRSWSTWKLPGPSGCRRRSLVSPNGP
jgi:SIR2-like domain